MPSSALVYGRPVPDHRPMRWLLAAALVWGIGAVVVYESGTLSWLLQEWSWEALQQGRLRHRIIHAALVVAAAPLFALAMLACVVGDRRARRLGKPVHPWTRLLMAVAAAGMLAALFYLPPWWQTFRLHWDTGGFGVQLNNLSLQAAYQGLVPAVVLVAAMRRSVSWRFVGFALAAQAGILVWLSATSAILLPAARGGSPHTWEYLQLVVVAASVAGIIVALLRWPGMLPMWGIRTAAAGLVIGYVVIPCIAHASGGFAAWGYVQWGMLIGGWLAHAALPLAALFWPAGAEPSEPAGDAAR